MDEKRLYEVMNPSDKITFRATVAEAACIAERLRPSLYFVEDVETGEVPSVDDLQATYDNIWTSADRIASYAAAYRSFTVGTPAERAVLENSVKDMEASEAAAFRERWHDKRRTSMNDICRQVWKTADKIAAYEPEVQA